jgi:arylformamidase
VEFVDLTHPIVTGMAQWPGDDQPLAVRRLSDHGPGSHMSSAVAFGCHVGTHIDLPLHFRAGEPDLGLLPPEAFIGRARVVRAGHGEAAGALPATLLDGVDTSDLDFVLFDTGWSRHWGTGRYYREWPWYGEDLAGRLAAAGLKGTGLDTPSLDPHGGQRAHDICAAAGLINVENLTGLGSLPAAAFTLFVLPLRLAGAEASPVRAVALVDAGTGGRP